MTALRDPRRDRLARIHMGKKALGLSDPEYRALLVRASADEAGLGGFDSAANMTEAQHLAVLREMTRLGFKADDRQARKEKWAGRPKYVKHVPMLRKIEALLADAKRPWSYAHSMAKKMFHVNRLEWLNDHDLHKLVAALQADANRRGKKA